jgi:KDO2-lipid IV(A) lauroyltransferase
MTLLAKIANKNDLQVLMFWAKRLPKGKGYELNLEPVELDLNGDNLEDHVASMNHCIEDLIRKIPEQYMWSYKRFKSTHTYG